jgi:hypothetical protein
MSLVMGVAISVLTILISRPIPVDVSCASTPGGLWTPVDIGTVFNKDRGGWPFIYHEKVQLGAQKCYAPGNIDTSIPYNGPQGQFIGYSTFSVASFIKNVIFWSLITLGLDLYLNYVFMPKRSSRKKK